jgi:hypothetical protein
LAWKLNFQHGGDDVVVGVHGVLGFDGEHGESFPGFSSTNHRG